MSDPISGGAVQKAAQLAKEMQAAQAEGNKPGGPSQFDAVMDKMAQQNQAGAPDSVAMKNAVEQSVQRQMDQMPAADRTRLRVEMEQNLQGREHSDQVRYFAERIETSRGPFESLDQHARQTDLGAFRNKVETRLEDMRSNYGELDRFLSDFSGGKQFSQEELLAIQIKCHQMAQSVELLSKTVEQGVGGMKTIFQTNV